MQTHHCQRGSKGGSMATVLLMSTIGSLFIGGMFSLLGPTYHKAMQGKQEKILRGTAEASLDWAVNEMNKKGSSAVPDDTTKDDSSYSQINSVPSRILDGNGPCNVQAKVTVQNHTAPTNSYIYDSSLDWRVHPEMMNKNYWRLVTSTTTLGGRSKTIEVLLKPTLAQENIATDVLVDGNPIKMPFSTWAMFSRGQFDANGNVVTDAYDSRNGLYSLSNRDPLGGSVGTNGAANLAGQVVVGGNLDVTNARPKPGDAGYDSYASNLPVNVQSGGNAVINGELNTNGDQLGFDPSNTGLQLPPGSTAIETNLDAPPKTFPPAPSAPADATNLGAIDLSGNSTMTLPAGNYIVSSLHIAGNAKLTTTGNVKIYIQGSSTGTAVHINGYGILNSGGVPTNLSLFYNGNGDVHINGNAGFKGLVYAPNAAVHINGNADYYGAVVGNAMDVNGNVKFHYDKALGDVGSAPYYWYTPQVIQTITTQVPTLGSYKVVSWREL